MSSTSNNSTDACDDCLAHAAQIDRLGARIQSRSDDTGNRTGVNLIGLDIPELEETLQVNGRPLPTPSVAQIRNDCEERQITAICQHSDKYPSQLRELDAPPRVLFCRGNTRLLTETSRDQMAAIVGARKATGYGLEVAATLGRSLAEKGVTVVSGMALGIDGATHRGALEKGKTIAVLACGCDRPYPASHSRLYRQIVECGLVVSEVVPGGDAWRWSFPARNRIVAALTGATVVVEAAWRSGSLITATLAHELGRPVGAVPGPGTAGSATGTNQLIRDGIAKLVIDANDVPVGPNA